MGGRVATTAQDIYEQLEKAWRPIFNPFFHVKDAYPKFKGKYGKLL